MLFNKINSTFNFHIGTLNNYIDSLTKFKRLFLRLDDEDEDELRTKIIQSAKRIRK